MKTWSFYDPQTGMLTSRKLVSTSDAVLADNTPPGLVAIEGRFDELSQRIDLATKQVMDWQPPAPDADHEWNADKRRWVKRADVAEREARALSARAQIDALEAKGVRAMRELVVDPQNLEARRRVAQIDAAIAELRHAVGTGATR